MSLRILYIGKHDSGGNDDEGAITHALQALGHDVQRLRERRAQAAHRMHDVDFCLFHHCQDYGALADIKRPKVAWIFDLIDYPDPQLARRNQERRSWMRHITRIADVVFMTDGDWVAHDKSGKLHWLPQGADERVVGAGTAADAFVFGYPTAPLLFTGIDRGGGQERVAFVRGMREKYGDDFLHISRGVYRRDLADLIASSQIVLAPAGPVTGRYFSNRVFNVCGFGGFLLHPYSDGLASMYEPGGDLVYYHDRDDMHAKIRLYLESPEERQRIAAAGLARTRSEHLYRHRLAVLIEIVKARLNL